MRLQGILSEASRIEKELEGKKKSLGEKEAATYLKRISKLFYHASREVETREQQKKAAQSLYSVLSAVAENVRPGEKRLSDFLGGSHGVTDTMLLSLYPALPLKQVKDTLWYNSHHWRGAAELLSGKRGVKNKVSSRFLAKLIKNTSHVVKYGFGGVVPVRVRGKTELTPGELFVVMRSASNAYHSLKLKTVLQRFRRVLEEPEALKRAADHLSSSKNFREDFRRALAVGVPAEKVRGVPDEKTSETILSQEPEAWAWHGFLHPDRKKDVLNDLLERRFDKFGEEHLNVLARASGLPWHAVTLFNEIRRVGVPINELLSLVDESTAKPSLNIILSRGTAVLKDTGLGTRYGEKFYKYRSGGQTSGYLQKRGAKEILLDIHDGGAKTTVVLNA